MEKRIDIDGEEWRVFPLTEASDRLHAGGDWHLVRVRFENVSDPDRPPRTTWLRCEEDVPAKDVIAQYDEAALVEAFLAAEEADVD